MPIQINTSVKGKEYFSANLRCDFSSSVETPRSLMPRRPNSANESRKEQASFVQPGVSSFG